MDLQNCYVVIRFLAYKPRVKCRPVSQRYLSFGGVANDVVVGDDVAIGVPNESTSGALFGTSKFNFEYGNRKRLT